MRTLMVLLVLLAAGPALAADGPRLFADQCASCHLPGGASSVSGPTLKGVVWRKVAGRDDFAYSGALKSLGGSWSPARLDGFLKDTQGAAPGAGMFFAIDDPAERKAIVDYLKTTP
ncbi:MAG TPA: c-type cytochrome [Caulobacteraceae bacterium]